MKENWVACLYVPFNRFILFCAPYSHGVNINCILLSAPHVYTIAYYVLLFDVSHIFVYNISNAKTQTVMVYIRDNFQITVVSF